MRKAKELRVFKRALAKRATKSELLFERKLKEYGEKYKKQMIFGFYILDFCIVERLLNIEIDGGYHTKDKQILYDKRRNIFIEKSGLRVLRIKNEDVESFNMDILKEYKRQDKKEFGSALGRAGGYKGALMNKPGYYRKFYKEL